MAAPTVTAARCVGQSARRSYYGGTQPLGRCQRPVAFAVMGYGRHGGHLTPVLTCQAHLGGLAASATQPRVALRDTIRAATVMAVTPAGLCPRCGERPDWHEPGATCPVAG